MVNCIFAAFQTCQCTDPDDCPCPGLKIISREAFDDVNAVLDAWDMLRRECRW